LHQLRRITERSACAQHVPTVLRPRVLLPQEPYHVFPVRRSIPEPLNLHTHAHHIIVCVFTAKNQPPTDASAATDTPTHSLTHSGSEPSSSSWGILQSGHCFVYFC
jgi:hypothetical protein